jgi:hypothetical protein
MSIRFFEGELWHCDLCDSWDNEADESKKRLKQIWNRVLMNYSPFLSIHEKEENSKFT